MIFGRVVVDPPEVSSMASRRSILVAAAGIAAALPGRAAATATAAPPVRDRATAASPRAGASEAPRLLLARPYTDRIDPALCLVSEKFDGVRAVWDGRRLRHRSGRDVHAPPWFLDRLPPVPLDGELWLGRGRFDALSAAVRRARPDDAEWREIRYLVFELPGADGPFEARAAAIRRLVEGAGWDRLEAVGQERVADRAALRRRLDRVVAGGGEGLMLHLASAPYGDGRSDVLTKLKPYLDAEATVVGFRAGQGKYTGEAGALEVRTPDGRRFFIGAGLSDALRHAPPPRGSVVTYRYHDLTETGLPRFASFLRVHDGL